MLIACYGSLKKGYYNHSAVGPDAEFKGNATVHGVMYSNGSYPKLYRDILKEEEQQKVERKNPEFLSSLARDHVLEVYDVNDYAFRSINGMELGAGYIAESIETPYGPATIWYMPHERFSSSDKWVEKY